MVVMLVTRRMYHTQEKRRQRLTIPIICVRDDAWLGDGYYFWHDCSDAELWGQNSKRTTGSYEVYQADIDCADVLDTVFNEDHYRFWLEQVEKAAKTILEKTGLKPTIREINAYFKEKGQWNSVAGILFQDIPQKSTYLLIQSFYYRKRIQMAVYDLQIITNVAFFNENKCS